MVSCIYLAYFLVLLWAIPIWEYLELIVLSALSVAVVFVVGDRHPGIATTFIILLIATYLGRVYTVNGVTYSLPYAKVAVISLLSMLIIPIYLTMSEAGELSEVIIGGAYIVAFMASVAGPRSLAISLSLFASLSTVTVGYMLAIAMSVSYSVFYLTATYVAKFSTTDVSKLVAIPIEFSRIEKEYLGDWALIRLFLSLTLFALGLLLSRFAEERMRKTYTSHLERRIVKAFVLGIATKMAIAISITVLATLLTTSLADIPATVLITVAVVGALSSIRSYIDLAERVHSLVAECHEHAESLSYKIKISEAVLGEFQGSSLRSFKDLEESSSEAKKVLSSYESIKHLGVTDYPAIFRTCRKLEEVDEELGNKILNVVSELDNNIKTLLSISASEVRKSLILILDEMRTLRREPERMGALPDLISRITQALRRYCHELHKMLSETIPKSYGDIFGIEFSIREIPKCSGSNFGDIQAYQNYVLAALLGMDRQLDSLISKLDKLASEARRLSGVLEAHGLRSHQLMKLLEVYRKYFSQAYLANSLEAVEKVLFMSEIYRNVMSEVSTLLEGFQPVEINDSNISRVTSEFMKPLEESLRELASHEISFLDSIVVLEGVLKNVSSSTWSFSSMYTLLESLQLLRSIQPLVSDYIRDGVRRGYRFEEIFPLREDLRQFWVILYGSGG